MDGINDMGGMQGFGRVQKLTADPPFAEPWEGKAFVIGALAARISGTNLHAYRHAINRVPPPEYLVGYWNRWTMARSISVIGWSNRCRRTNARRDWYFRTSGSGTA